MTEFDQAKMIIKIDENLFEMFLETIIVTLKEIKNISWSSYLKKDFSIDI